MYSPKNCNWYQYCVYYLGCDEKSSLGEFKAWHFLVSFHCCPGLVIDVKSLLIYMMAWSCNWCKVIIGIDDGFALNRQYIATPSRPLGRHYSANAHYMVPCVDVKDVSNYKIKTKSFRRRRRLFLHSMVMFCWSAVLPAWCYLNCGKCC